MESTNYKVRNNIIRYIYFYILLAFYLCLTLTVSAQIQRVKVTGGILQGIANNGITTFKGIPFAAPPVGDLRWKAPQPVIPWEGVKKADSYGPIPIQDKQQATMMALPADNMNEDCLYLNIWTGAQNVEERQPVMVWIYGGGFTSGAASCPIYNGTYYAQKGIVFVTINYRLGVMGFLAHPELSAESGKGSGAYGIQDQVAALKWVRDNIANFGGDPSRVTIIGQSAGSYSVSLLTQTPAAKGLFHRAISQSGIFIASPKEGNEHSVLINKQGFAERKGVEFIDKLNVRNIQEARTVDAEKLQRISSANLIENIFRPTADGEYVFDNPYQLYNNGEFNDTPYLLGMNSDEGGALIQPAQALSPNDFKKMVRKTYAPAAKNILKSYPHANTEETLQSQKDIWSATLFGWPTWSLAKIRNLRSKHKTFIYYFDIRNELLPNGAIHSAEVPYVFHFPYAINSGKPNETDLKVMEFINSYWINFVKTGDPNGSGLQEWPAYDEKKKMTMVIDSDPSARPFPILDKCKAFDKYYRIK